MTAEQLCQLYVDLTTAGLERICGYAKVNRRRITKSKKTKQLKREMNAAERDWKGRSEREGAEREREELRLL